MKKWMVIGISSSTLLVWFAVIWLYLGQQNEVLYYSDDHHLAQRLDVTKQIFQEVKTLTRANQHSANNQGDALINRSWQNEEAISIDELLLELNISY